jgi:hypothetical protein
MLAKVYIHLPFPLTIPIEEQFQIYEYEDSGYLIRIYPPSLSEVSDGDNTADEIRVNGKIAINADVMRIDFFKDSFVRTENGPYDPPLDLINKTANSFLARLRHVLNASKIKPIEFPFGHSWNVQYRNDDGTKLLKGEGLIGGRGMVKHEFSFAALNNEVWEDVHSLAPDYSPPAWKTLLLDAEAILPEIGPAIILTFTALEVFISSILDSTAQSGRVPEDLWEWINTRGNLKEPSIEERYSFLSKYLLGKSLKSDNELWEVFKNLRKARNSFAHYGLAKIGNDKVDVQKARYFIDKSKEIIEFIREAVPQELLWPEFKNDIKVQIKTVI